MRAGTIPLLVIAAAITGSACSSGDKSPGASTTTGSQTLTTTVSAERVAFVGSQFIKPSRARIADVRRLCGGNERIEQTDPARAAQCRNALTALSDQAQRFGRALALLRAPTHLEPLVALTIDTARPVIALVANYPDECLPTPTGATALVTVRCDAAGREVSAGIAEFENSFHGWGEL